MKKQIFRIGVKNFPPDHGGVESEKVTVKAGAFIGIGTVVFPGVTIGEKAIVGAMSLVRRDIPAHAVAFGQPAMIRKKFQK